MSITIKDLHYYMGELLVTMLRAASLRGSIEHTLLPEGYETTLSYESPTLGPVSLSVIADGDLQALRTIFRHAGGGEGMGTEGRGFESEAGGDLVITTIGGTLIEILGTQNPMTAVEMYASVLNLETVSLPGVRKDSSKAVEAR